MPLRSILPSLRPQDSPPPGNRKADLGPTQLRSSRSERFRLRSGRCSTPALRIGFSLFLLVLVRDPSFAASPAPPELAPTGTEDVERRSAELNAIKERIQGVSAELEAVQGQQKDIEAELRAAEWRVGELAREIHRLDGEIAAQQQRLDGLQQQRKPLILEVQHQRSALADQLRAAYMIGRQERLKLVLNQEDPDIVSRIMLYYDYLNRARARRITEVEEAIAALREVETRILSETEHLHAMQIQTKAEQQRLEHSQAERDLLRQQLAQQIRERGQELVELETNAKRLQSILTEIEQRRDEAQTAESAEQRFSRMRGALVWPVTGRLASGSTEALYADGVLIEVPRNAQVKAIHYGRVVFSDWLRGFGLLLIVDHGDGYMSLYGNNEGLFKDVGDWVQPGEVIAAAGVGQGNRQGIYFAIRHQGKPINPRLWCKAVRGNKIGGVAVDRGTQQA